MRGEKVTLVQKIKIKSLDSPENKAQKFKVLYNIRDSDFDGINRKKDRFAVKQK